ncbi:restriction endonuclease subunit S [Aeromonas hydrophila]|uniref:restriction endonuclease subunit S n=1 Tax=Aeromonas TaxID=642 RepID=UPI0038CFD3F5
MTLTAMPKYEAYKDSGVEWIGDIPAHWNIRKLKYISNINNQTLPENTAGDFLFDYVDIGSVTLENGIEKVETFRFSDAPSRARRLAKQGDTVVSTVRTYLKAISYVDRKSSEYIYSTGFAVINPKDENSSKYLTHFIKSDAFTNQVDDVAKGISYPAINSSELSNLLVVEPSTPEKNAIADFLDEKTAKIDDAIAIKERQIALLNERKQILIQQAVTNGFNPCAPLKDSGIEWIGKIPEHWECKKVKHLFRLAMEQSEKNNNHELLSVYSDIGVKPRKELEERGNKASTTDGYWIVKKGDVVVNKLLAWMGAIGLSEYDGVTSPAYDILRPKKRLNGHFYHYLFRSKFCSTELKRHSRGIMDMRLRLYFDKFGVIEVPYPPKEEQDKIIEKLNELLSDVNNGINVINKQIKKYQEYKSTLINSAVTGKIKVV